MPHGGKRAIVRCRDDHYLHPVPPLNIDGLPRPAPRRPPARRGDALRAGSVREAGILTSLDGGGLRSNTHDLLAFIDVAIVAERLCEQMNLTRRRDARLPQGPRLPDRRRHPGRARPRLVRRDRHRERPAGARRAAERVIDTNGAGDIFHGAYVYSAMARPDLPWREHFMFARAASAHAIQHLGNEASLPRLADIARVQEQYAERRLAARASATASPEPRPTGSGSGRLLLVVLHVREPDRLPAVLLVLQLEGVGGHEDRRAVEVARHGR